MGDRAYVTLEGTGRLLVLDPSTGAELAQVDVGPKPRPLAISHDGKRVFAGRFISPADRGRSWKWTGPPSGKSAS